MSGNALSLKVPKLCTRVAYLGSPILTDVTSGFKGKFNLGFTAAFATTKLQINRIKKR